MKEELIDIATVCRRISLSRPAIYRQIASGNFPAPLKIGRAARWREEAIDAWIAQLGSKNGDIEERPPKMEGSGHD
ncbi:MAG: AlpA family phage regulatory protein [Alphaproteobacteria bacterium]